MMNPIVSVIIPTYNTAQYICESIDSVLSQSYKDYEIIVVDDGSTDNTKEFLKPYMGQIRYIFQENRGRAGARNTGIRTARGKYIAFLDSDDLWTPGKLEKQVEIMQGNENIDFLFGDKQRFSDDGTIVTSSMFAKRGYGPEFFGDSLYVRDPYRKLLNEPFIPTGTVIMKRECFDRTGLFDEAIYAEDWEFWLRSALFNNMAYSTELWELERDREGSGSKYLKSVYLSNIAALEKHEREFKDILLKLNIDLNSKLREIYRNTGYLLLLTHDKLLARECLKKSLLRGFQARTFFYWLSTFVGMAYVKAIQRFRESRGKTKADE